ncbi:O-antigen ligase family protein [Eubacterium limosum]|uniref:O-antigen ligase family protein n=1 Tax=Eubacterium limosum TaxID=1736 RepID=UPI003723EA72
MLMKKLKNLDIDYLALTVCLLIAFNPIKNVLILSVRKVIQLPLHIDVIILYSLACFTIFKALLAIKQMKKDILILLVLLLCILLATLIITGKQNNAFLLDIYIQTLFSFVVGYTFCRNIDNYHLLKIYLECTAIVLIITQIFSIFILKENILMDKTYSQEQAYILLPAVIISLNSLFDKITLVHLVNFFVGIWLIFMMGTRGPLACMLFFTLVRVLLKTMQAKRKYVIIGSVMIVTYGVYTYFTKLMEIALIISENLHLSTRSIIQILNGSFFMDSTRNVLKVFSIKLIQERPLFGWGMGNDRLKLASMFHYDDAIGWYPHNFFLEILVQFGVIIGFCFIVYIAYVIFVNVFSKQIGYDEKNVFLIFLAIGFFPLLFSGSYMTWTLFWAFLGFGVSGILYEKEHRDATIY